MKNKHVHGIDLLRGAIVALAFFVLGGVGQAQAASAPTIITPKANETIAPDVPLTITGLAQNNASVFFFLDNTLIGGVKVKNGKTGTGSFAYKFKTKPAYGTHTLKAQAVVSAQNKSPYTTARSFTIPKVWPRRLDGVIVDANKATGVPIAVMIENMSVVRPQSGLASASVVYEALAEGGIPRFLAIFAREDMPKLGPVRSARPYYVDWVKEYGAIPLLHAGGSRDALNEFGRLKVRSVDALVSKSAKYFGRIGGAAGDVHNLFTKQSQYTKVDDDYKLSAANTVLQPWKFKNDLELAKRPNEKRQLVIDFKSGRQYIVAYQYDKATNSYKRFNGGLAHEDANYPKRTQIKVKNVVVQIINKERVLDAKHHLALDITGTGRGFLLQDGKLQQITWKKPKADSRTRFYFLNGKEVEFNRGNTWIEVVPKDRPVLFR